MYFSTVAGSSTEDTNRKGLKDQIVWSMAQCGEVFAQSVEGLRNRVEASQEDLVWDKDGDECINFVVACADVRAHIFGISCHSCFDVEGNAIQTSYLHNKNKNVFFPQPWLETSSPSLPLISRGAIPAENYSLLIN
jgi:hypothetical protein